VYGYYSFPKPSAPGFPTAADPADRWHGYMVTNAHRVEAEVGADRPASAPLSGAAAAAPPAGADGEQRLEIMGYVGVLLDLLHWPKHIWGKHKQV
jgi:hypothetical protein